MFRFQSEVRIVQVKPIKLIALFFMAALTALGTTPKVGDRVPQFSLPSADGRVVALKDFAGKKLVLVFYRGYW